MNILPQILTKGKLSSNFYNLKNSYEMYFSLEKLKTQTQFYSFREKS